MPINYYAKVLTVLPEAALLVTPSGQILAANDALKALLDDNQLVNTSVLDKVNSDDQQSIASYLRRCAQSNHPVVGSIQFTQLGHEYIQACHGGVLEPRTADSEAILLLRLKPRSKSNSRFLALQQQIDGLNREMERRSKAENALVNQSKRLEITLTSIGDAVIITDKNSCVTFLNPVAEKLTGWTSHTAQGKKIENILKVVDESTGASLDNPALKAIREGRVVSNHIESRLIPKDGQQLFIETTAAPIILGNNIEGVIVVCHDVSEKRRLQRQLQGRAEHLELMNQRKNQFLSMLAHELRSPLTPISNAAHLLKLQKQEVQTPNEPLRVIERQISHLKRLIDDLLDVSRISSGKMNVIKKKINFSQLIESVCNDFSPQFSMLDIQCVKQLPGRPVWIDADLDRITQVLHNLINNALKFTPEKGSVTVSLRADEHAAVFQISDTGIGIDESALSELFEPFTQAVQTLERSAGGLGLGLSLVKGIIDIHGGSVIASSEGLDRGAQIRVTLPSVQGEETTEQQSQKQQQSLAEQNILLIEDDSDTATTMQQLLELLGHQVHWSKNGSDGVDKALTLLPSLIICDIGLPGLDGFAVAKLLRKDKATQSIPLVALSGYGGADLVSKAKQAGFDQHITKPASLNQIHAALALAE